MKRQNFGTLHLWQFDLFDQAEVTHFVTARNTAGTEFTLSLSSTPDKDRVQSNRRALADAIEVAADRLYFPSQVHGTRIVEVTEATTKEEIMETDALVTSTPNICVCVMSADCVPILLYDRKNKAVAAVHSGWRGTVAKILEKTLSRMNALYGTTGQNIFAGIGPSVSQESYEVGDEVIREVQSAFGPEAGLMIPQAGNKAKLDLWKANQLQLLEFGVLPQNIEVGNLCTVKNNGDFFSARMGDSGRFAAGIMVH